MTRVQILELPDGASDERAPFVLVVDQCEPQGIALGASAARVRDYWECVAQRIGAQGVIVTPETIEIPANDVSGFSADAAIADPLASLEAEAE